MSAIPAEFSGVTAVTKANIYFDGKVVSQEVSGFIMNADTACRLAVYSGAITNEIVDAARATASTWTELARRLEKDHVKA